MSEQDGREQARSEPEFARWIDEHAEYIHAELRSEKKLASRIREQVSYIRAEFEKAGIEIGVVPSDRGVGYMYAEGQILVREQYLQRVLEILAGLMKEPKKYHADEPSVPRDDPGEPPRPAADRRPPKKGNGPENGEGGGGKPAPEPHGYRPVVPGLVLLELPSPALKVPDVLNVIDKLLGEGVATPNHVLTVAPEVGPCPATEPEVVYDGAEPSPGVCPDNDGAGVLVYVADTGLLKGADSQHSWLHGVRRGHKLDGHLQDWEPATELRSNGEVVIPPYAGHGTFVAGVVRCMAPQADVIVANVFRIAGSALESHFVRELVRALKLGVDIFHLSITAPTRGDLPLAAFEHWLKLTRQYKGVVCVVAAGNNSSSHPFWPAAFSEVVSVGALGADGHDRADFSNYGGWVDVYAPGRNLVNAYASGTYVCRVDPYKDQQRQFYGMAMWSGTSFSTPIVTGLIAARMYRTGENGKEAAAALLEETHSHAIPGVGAILLPHCGPGTGGAAQPPDCCCGRHQCPCAC